MSLETMSPTSAFHSSHLLQGLGGGSGVGQKPPSQSGGDSIQALLQDIDKILKQLLGGANSGDDSATAPVDQGSGPGAGSGAGGDSQNGLDPQLAEMLQFIAQMWQAMQQQKQSGDSGDSDSPGIGGGGGGIPAGGGGADASPGAGGAPAGGAPAAGAPAAGAPAGGDAAPQASDGAPQASDGAPAADASPSPSTAGGMVGPANGKYDGDIEKSAQKYGLDPNMVKCLIAKESQGNPNAESSAGAVGLGQLKPSTASEVLGKPVSADQLKSDTSMNIDATCAYLKKLSDQKGGSIPDTLGSYNQGPNADWKSIPESQDYVSSIMNSMQQGKLPQWG